ncbi:helix-turn-helix domain-containing protein [Intestinibacillus massiliensis]|uniref:helix-turn-helix domain-containing protein n=1 Tax=Intestinibacillus massiliensis TaxID=1871029 RepID=UPI000B34C540|nr:helix-turn-helix domain-containing protein [Intestinibacillus massiliensis]
MAKKPHNEEVKQRALAMLAAGVGVSEVAARLGVPKQTVSRWKAEGTNDAVFAEQQRKNKARLVDTAWEAIHDATEITAKRLRTAREDEKAFAVLLDEIEGAEHITEDQRAALFRKFQKLKVTDLGELSRVIGTLYDKQALAASEATAIVGGTGKLDVTLKVV